MEEIETEEGSFFDFTCDPNHVLQVRKKLSDQLGDKAVIMAEVQYQPQVTVKMGRKLGEVAMVLIDEINKLDQVTALHHNIEFARPSEKDKDAKDS